MCYIVLYKPALELNCVLAKKYNTTVIRVLKTRRVKFQFRQFAVTPLGHDGPESFHRLLHSNTTQTTLVMGTTVKILRPAIVQRQKLPVLGNG